VAAWDIVRVDDRIALSGELRLADGPAIWRALRRLARPANKSLDLDITRATTIDGSIMALLVDVRARIIAQGVRCEILGGDQQLREVVRLFRGNAPAVQRLPPPVHVGAINRLGAVTQRAARRSASFISFVGELAATWRHLLAINMRSVPALIVRGGADGVPIVLLLNFLLGAVVALQTMQYLRLYGADIYVADVIGISVTREFAPLMTAIILAGRSGAAYAAELGTMRVSEEVDALRTMGFAPVPYLVVPRIIALAIAAPVLTLFGDVVGVIGGLAVGNYSLDVTPHAFVAEMRTAIVPSDVWTGLGKSIAFGGLIALIGCRQGLTTTGAASGVGRGTTSTVVQCLFAIVIVDTAFTLLFREFAL
jgi:phospholipid/cholesterol/gamma-HCH transport system permease protein